MLSTVHGFILVKVWIRCGDDFLFPFLLSAQAVLFKLAVAGQEVDGSGIEISELTLDHVGSCSNGTERTLPDRVVLDLLLAHNGTLLG